MIDCDALAHAGDESWWWYWPVKTCAPATTPHAIKFCDPPTRTSPTTTNYWTTWRKLVKRGPKHRLPYLVDIERSISAVSRMTSLGSGVLECDCDLSVRNVAFFSVERSASNSETAWARCISGFNNDTFPRATDMIGINKLHNKKACRCLRCMNGGERLVDSYLILLISHERYVWANRHLQDQDMLLLRMNER